MHFFNGLHLKDDLNQDRIGLNRHGVYLSDADKAKLKVFDKYALMDLSKFKCTKHISVRHNVTSWTNGKKEIYEVISVLPASPRYETKDIKTNKKTTETNPYKGTFTFHTYIIDVPNQQRLIYQTQVGEGFVYFRIGKRMYNPLKEDILLGVNYPNEKEITDLIN